MTGKPNIGIPTVYKNVRFRSRLEAKYAAFFDELGWHWEYEPFDLDGYIPDFLVNFEFEDVLFEVKGFAEEMKIAQFKVEVSGWNGPAIVATGAIEGATIGKFLEPSEEVFSWSDADLFTCLSCGQVSVLAADGKWQCRSCGYGAAGGNEHVGSFDPAEAWARAINRTQWRPGS